LKVFTLATRYGVGGAELNSQLISSRLNSDCSISTKSLFIMYSNGDLVSDPSRICLLSSDTANPFKLLFAFFLFLKIIYIERPDVIVGFQPLANVFGSLSVLFSKTKFIGTQRNPSFSQGRLIRLLEMFLGSTPLYSANIAVSNAVIDSYSHYPESYLSKLSCIYNGFAKRPVKISKEKARHILNLPNDKRIVGFLGRIAPQKHPEFMLEVISILAMKDVILVYAGTGPELENLKKRAFQLGVSEQVIFLGAIEYKSVFVFYDAIDVFVLPSRFEGFGRTLVEAMQSKLPIIANDLQVTREVLFSNDSVINKNAAAWADRLRVLFTNQILYDHACELGLQRASFFSIDNMIQGYYKVIMASQRGANGCS